MSTTNTRVSVPEMPAWVLLIIPPDKGYGPEGNTQAGISGTETLVFVVDILAAA
jgi:FKBP-type peptidyl-prolyl cis-trans isomerase